MTTPPSQGLVQRRLTGNPSEAVILAVSEISDVDPLEFEECLHDVVDPDALDKLTDWSADSRVGVSFTFESYTVTIEGDRLVVEDRQAIE
jgi:hypothetical protein